MSDTRQLTLTDKKKLEADLAELMEAKKRVAEEIQIARGFGDLSENAEYDAAKNDQASLEQRINELKAMIENEVVVERISKRRLCKGCSYIGTVDDGETCPACGGELYQRADDNADSVRTRLEAYDKSTAPLIDYYRGTGILSSVNGDQAPEDVFASIKEAAQL